MALPETDRWFNRLPQYVRDSDTSGQLRAYMSLIGDQLDDLVSRIDAASYWPLDDGGEVGDTSALVDPTQAGRFGDPILHLKWISQMLGVQLNTADTLDSQIDAVRYASAGWRSGTKEALADAARSVLSGTKYVRIENHYAGDPWAVNIRTRASETPPGNAVVNAVLLKNAKPAGIVILNTYFSATWNDLETFRPTWDNWADTWTNIEETNAPGSDPGNIPDAGEQTGGGMTLPTITNISPSTLEQDVDPDARFIVSFSSLGNDPETISADFTYSDGTTVPMWGANEPGNPDAPGYDATSRIFTPVDGWEPGETVHVVLRPGIVMPGTDYAQIIPGGPFEYEFSVTPEQVVPLVVRTIPVDGTLGVDATTSIQVFFNLALDPDSVNSTNFVLTQLATGTVIPAGVTGGTSATDPVLVDPVGNFVTGTDYKLTIKGDGSSGVQANPNGLFMLEDEVITFKTAGSPPVITPPTVSATTPKNSSTNNDPAATITAQFSEPINAQTLTASTVVLTEVVGGAVVPTNRNYNTATNLLTVTPTTSALKNSTQYQLQLTTGITNVNGTAMAVPVTVQWTTSAAVSIPGPGTKWTRTYFNDFKAPLDFVNDWWQPYHTSADNNRSTFKATWNRNQVTVETSGNGLLVITGVKDASKKYVNAIGDLIGGGIALGKKGMNPIPGFCHEFKMRVDKGNGFSGEGLGWPDKGNWPKDGEPDYHESPKGDRKTVYVTHHYSKDGTSHDQIGKGIHTVIPGFDASLWHVYRCEYTPNRVTYFADNVKILEITDPAKIETGDKIHLCFQLDPAGAAGWITPWDSTTPSRVREEIDWIAQYAYTP